MNVAFFTESGFVGKYPRTFENARTDVAWQIALNAYHYPYNHRIEFGVRDNKEYDIGIVIFPKKNPIFDLSVIKTICKKVLIMQEGPHWYWQDWKVADQFAYLNILSKVDGILAHNIKDQLYYKGIGYENVFVLPTLMIEESVPSNINTNQSLREGIMIGGNFTSWYSGMDSYLVANSLENPPKLFCPSMGRKQPDEESISDITYLPYLNLSTWLYELSYRKYGIHLMRTHAAGTFALNCARLSIPCIGYEGLDTQTFCHQHLTVEVGDIKKAKKLLNKLVNDSDFYSECSIDAITNYTSLYTESTFMKCIKYIFDKI